MLPIAENSSPDWGYMEEYGKMLFNRLKLQYLTAKADAITVPS
jgi:hypothetical protein